jgi:hypothetical protein
MTFAGEFDWQEIRAAHHRLLLHKEKSTGPGVSATISTISSSRQCSRQYIYACELAAAPLFHPIITRRDRHT